MPVQTTDGHDPFALDLALPDRTLAVGPRDWRGRSGPLLPPERICADLDACLATLLADAGDAPHRAPAVPGDYNLVLLHAEWPAVHEPTEQLEMFLQTLASRHQTILPILLYRRLDTDLCVRLLRAGLFDAVSVPVEPKRWTKLCADAAETARRQAASRDLQHQAQATSRLLHAQRRRLGETTAQARLPFRDGLQRVGVIAEGLREPSQRLGHDAHVPRVRMDRRHRQVRVRVVGTGRFESGAPEALLTLLLALLVAHGSQG